MVKHQHRVDRRRDRNMGFVAPPLPKDVWRGATFVEGNGTELEVVWNGHKDGPTLCGDGYVVTDGNMERGRLRL